MADLSQVEQVARQTRLDFEASQVSDDEIIAASDVYSVLHLLAIPKYRDVNRRELLRAGVRKKVGALYVPVPIMGKEVFPKNYCNAATPVLAKRLQDSGCLGKNKVRIIEGGCGEDTRAEDKTVHYDNYHAFVGISATALGKDTIVDITADQFNIGLPPVYFGPLVPPWTRRPNLDFDSY